MTATYRSQVALSKKFLESPEGALANKSNRGRLDIWTETIDALQGLECHIYVISKTRTNKYGNIDSMKDGRRINVAASMAQNVLVVVGDGSTPCDRSTITNWRACLHTECVANIVHKEALTRTGGDKERQKL